jgi:hypothetical protein
MTFIQHYDKTDDFSNMFVKGSTLCRYEMKSKKISERCQECHNNLKKCTHINSINRENIMKVSNQTEKYVPIKTILKVEKKVEFQPE